MCQYSANEGNATDWHLMHLGQFAVSGVGLIFTEAVGVEMTGRISPGCLALCTDEQEQNLKLSESQEQILGAMFDFLNKKIDDIEVQDEQQVSDENDESQTKLEF